MTTLSILLTCYTENDLILTGILSFLAAVAFAFVWRLYERGHMVERSELEKLIGQILSAYYLIQKGIDIEQNKTALRDLIPVFARTVMDSDMDPVRKALLLFKNDFEPLANQVANIKSNYDFMRQAPPSSSYDNGVQDNVDYSFMRDVFLKNNPSAADVLDIESAALAIEKLFVF
jgi:hypothetical protein